MLAKNPPLIAHVIFRLDVGGLENGLVNLINGLPFDRYRHAIVCIDSYTDFRDRILRDDVEIIAINKRPGTDFSALWRLYKTFRRLRPDIVHTRNIAALDALLPAVLACSAIRVHGEHGWGIDDVGGINRKYRLLRKLHSSMVHRYVALSKELATYLSHDLGIGQHRIVQLYNGVDNNIFRPTEEKQKLRDALSQDFDSRKILIGTVGRLNPVKDQTILAKAFVLLLRENPDLRDRVRLIIVGEGDLRAEIVQCLEAAGLIELAWLPGSRDDIARILQTLDLFVQPSLAEGISNTVLEAMSCGLPVIATDVGGNPELVQDHKTGTLIPSANHVSLAEALKAYVLDSVKMTEHGRAGCQRVSEFFSLNKMLHNYRLLYDELLDLPRENDE